MRAFHVCLVLAASSAFHLPTAQAQKTERLNGEPGEAILTHPIPSLSEPGGDSKEVKTLTLEGSIKTAIETATGVQKAKGDTLITGEQLIQGYAQFLPNLVATAGYNRVNGNTYYTTAQPAYVQSNSYGANYQLSTTLNIFNGFGDIAALRADLARKKASDLTLKRAKQEIALDVAQTYLQVILDRQIVKIAEKNLASSQARERLLEEQTKVGVRNLADLFRQQAQTSSDESYLVSSQNKERSDELLLLRKLRLDADNNYQLSDPDTTDDVDSALFNDEHQLVRTAIENRTDLKAFENRSKAYRSDVTSARASYWPKLDFGLSVGSEARDLQEQIVGGVNFLPANQASLANQFPNNVAYTIGLTLTCTIFDRWMTTAAVQKAAVMATNSHLDYEDRQNQVVAEIRQAYGDYRAVLQQLDSTKKGLLAAQKAYEVMQGRYQVGSANFVDLTTAQAALVQTESARAQAQIAFALQTRTMQTALGTAPIE